MSKYAGMTTLDRLQAAGLLQDFERAIARGARKAAIDMLVGVDLTPLQAAAVVDGAEEIRRRMGLKG